MARITWDSARLPTVAGSYTTLQSGLVVVTYGDGAVETLRGDFVFAGGFFVGGFITDITIVKNGATALSITDVRFPATTYFDARLVGDANYLSNLIFGDNDQIFGASGDDFISGGAGADTMIALDGADTIDGADGDDDVNGNVGSDVVYGGEGADIVRGGKDNDTISGGAGNDPHVNGNIGADLVFGGAGNDTVFGGQDADTLHGEEGDDLLSGDLGSDILFGEAGADRFVLRAGSGLDWAADFNAAQGDRIQLTAGTAYTVTAISGQVVLDLGGGDQLGLTGVAAGSFSTGWVVFA